MTEKEMIGTLVRSAAGHDRGEYYIVVGTERNVCYVANGRERTIVSPKKKNQKLNT